MLISPDIRVAIAWVRFSPPLGRPVAENIGTNIRKNQPSFSLLSSVQIFFGNLTAALLD